MTQRAVVGTVAVGFGMLAMLLLVGLSLLPRIAPDIRLPSIPTVVPTLGAIGSVGRLTPGERGYTKIWVEQTGLRAMNRAYENRDTNGMVRALELWDTIDVPNDMPVRVTNRTADMIQVELVSGALAGRRGWTRPNMLVP